MKIRQNRWSLFKNIALSFGTFCVCAVFIWFALQFPASPLLLAAGSPTPIPNCAATVTPTSTLVPLPTCTCTATPSPYQSPYVLIPTKYQAPDRAQLAWLVYPPTTPTPTVSPLPSPPGIVLIHPGGWHGGSASNLDHEATDLAAAGYYVVSVNYELARCGLIPGQPCHDQDDSLPDMVTRETNDIKAFIVALENDSHVDHNRIGVVGGSAGATHAAWVALDTNATPNNEWPFWTADTRPKCAVMLSAGYDLSDRTPPPGFALGDSIWVFGTENYVNTANLAILKAKSPVSLVTTPTAEVPFRPLFMINSWFDSPPSYHQMVDIICALKAAGVPDSAYQTRTIPDSDEHSFAYWDNCDDGSAPPCTTIKDDVIAFLNAHL